MIPMPAVNPPDPHSPGGMNALVLAILDIELAIKEGLKPEQEGRAEIAHLMQMVQTPGSIDQAIAMHPPGYQ